MLNGLDLFSGIGGITLALAPWVRPVAYCEIEPYAQSVLLSRMADGQIPTAPIWDDVRSLCGSMLGQVDIIYGGFPCQDISTAGAGAGLDGERSGLYWEIHRLAGEIGPRFIFLENVPAITSRGGVKVVKSLTALGYDCRWTVLSALAVGANHKRERWWLLAHRDGSRELQPQGGIEPIGGWAGNCGSDVANPDSQGQIQGRIPSWLTEEISKTNDTGAALPDAEHGRRQRRDGASQLPVMQRDWWSVEPAVGRMAHGIPYGVDRIKGLGNAWVPYQARTAFKILSGLTEANP